MTHLVVRFSRQAGISKDEEGEIVFFQKGADTVMSSIVAANDWLDEETAKEVQEPEAVRAALRRQFALGDAAKGTLAPAVDLKGGRAERDDLRPRTGGRARRRRRTPQGCRRPRPHDDRRGHEARDSRHG